MDNPIMLVLILLTGVAAIISVFIALRYPEIILALAVLLGWGKVILVPVSDIIGIDIQILLFALFLFGLAFKILKNGWKTPRWDGLTWLIFFVFISFVLVMAMGLFYTPDQTRGKENLIIFTFFTPLALFGPIYVIDDIRCLKRFLSTTLVFCVSVGLVILISLSKYGWSWYPVSDQLPNRIASGEMAGVISLLTLFYYMPASTQPIKKIFWLVIFVFGIALLFLSASKGPAFAFGLTCLITVVISIKHFRVHPKVLRIAGLILVSFSVMAILLVMKVPLLFQLVTRMQGFIQGGIDDSPRMELFRVALDNFIQSPIIGLGTGSFYHVTYNGTAIYEHTYPHNILLEIMAELGIVGLITFVSLIVLSIFCFWRLKVKVKFGSDLYFLSNSLIALFTFTFMHFMVSSPVPSTRYFFVWVGLALALGRRQFIAHQASMFSVGKKKMDHLNTHRSTSKASA